MKAEINPLYLKIEEKALEEGFSNMTDLCRKSGASRGAMTDLKYCRSGTLSQKTIFALSSALKVSVSFFFGGAHDAKKGNAMNEMKIFDYHGNTVRTVERDGEPWFVLKDVCAVLGIANHKMTAQRLDEDEVSLADLTDSLGRKQETTIINESGLYNVLLRSDKPEAKPLRKWVTSEVLPSIRKTGSYNQKPLSPVEMFAMQAQINLDQERRLKAVEEKQDRFDGALAVMAAPMLESDGWQERAQKEINTTIEQFGLNHQMFRRDIYDEVERLAHVDLERRQTLLRNRMSRMGASSSECKAVSKLHVIARDPKLRPIFETVLRRKVVRLTQERGVR